jgi:hypothetical protein
MPYTVVDVEDIPPFCGTFKFVRHHLGARAFGEEVYLALEGSDTLEVGGETVEMRPGRDVLASGESRRRPAAGPSGMSSLVIGGPDGVYEPWTPRDT